LKNTHGIELIDYYPGSEPAYWLYTLKVENRDDFIKRMAEVGIMATELHKRNDLHSYLNDFGEDLPNLNEFYSKMVHLPCGWWLSDDNLELMVETINAGW
jgi:dTDP-4-amino-4,6-dideoxygalactose transaminase